MKLVTKYTLVLVAALALALSVLTFYRMQRDRANFEGDMTIDHRLVGHVLQANAVDIWRDRTGVVRPANERSIDHLIERANGTAGPTRFEWLAGDAAADESHRAEGHNFVSRFPVRAGGAPLGTIVVSESLDDTDRLIRHGVLFSVLSVVVVVMLSFAASLVLGRWLVGKPIDKLVDKARRIGHRDFTGAVERYRADELGELAAAMNAMSADLAQALQQITLETDARVHAVEQMRHADRLSTIGKLAAGVAHELGTPLSIVAGHAQMIAGREVIGDAILESAGAIDREATRMNRIVRQLLDFARRRVPEGTASEVATVAARCLELLSPMAKRSAITTTLEAGGPLRALIDEDSLQQVLTNLVVNAVQAMSAGGELRITTARALAASPEAPGDPPTPCIRVAVTDTGSGISEDVRAHIFEPFFTTKQPGDGTGLGLAVVYGIVADHHGWITVDSSDRGTTFSVFLQEARP
jgi:two-component system, NtrC family, sensor kinase